LDQILLKWELSAATKDTSSKVRISHALEYTKHLSLGELGGKALRYFSWNLIKKKNILI
jgi:hypothetical protein